MDALKQVEWIEVAVDGGAGGLRADSYLVEIIPERRAVGPVRDFFYG